jgi:hypothetical protein
MTFALHRYMRKVWICGEQDVDSVASMHTGVGQTDRTAHVSSYCRLPCQRRLRCTSYMVDRAWCRIGSHVGATWHAEADKQMTCSHTEVCVKIVV